MGGGWGSGWRGGVGGGGGGGGGGGPGVRVSLGPKPYSRGSNVSYALRSFSACSRTRYAAEHCVAIALAEGSAVGREAPFFRQRPRSGRVVAVETRRVHCMPRRSSLGPATGHGGRPGPGRDDLNRAYATPRNAPFCTCSAKPDVARVASRHELAQDSRRRRTGKSKSVIVERPALERHQHRRDRAPQTHPLKLVCSSSTGGT